MEEIIGFDPVIDEEDRCTSGGAHTYKIHREYIDNHIFYQEIICTRCGHISSAWAAVNEE